MTSASRQLGRDARDGPAGTPPGRLPETTPPSRCGLSLSSVSSGTVSGRACAAPGCGRLLPAGRRRFCSDLCRARGQRAERRYETGEFGQAAIRMIRTLARRVGASDIDELGALWEVRKEADRAAADAIDGLRAKGFSWAAIGAAAGLSAPGAYQWRRRHSRQSGINKSFRAAR
jgi:hypothetical protein